MFKQEVIYFNAVLGYADGCRVNVPGCVIQNDTAGQDIYVGLYLFLVSRLIETGNCINFPTVSYVGVVSPIHCSVQTVVFGIGIQAEVKHAAFFHHHVCPDLALQLVSRIFTENRSRFIAGIVISEFRKISVYFQTGKAVIEVAV